MAGTRTGQDPWVEPVARRAIGADAAARVAGVLRALADPLRLRIVSALATASTGRVAAGEVATLTALTAPTVSHHLRSLREAGVVVSRREGTRIFYALAPGMDRVAATLLEGLAATLDPPAPSGTGAVTAPAALDGGTAGPADAAAVLSRVGERLARRFADLDADLVTWAVRDSYTALARTARVTQHLPVLAERFAVERLEDIRRVRGHDPAGGAGEPDPPSRRTQVLFVCVANAGRSQLAAGLLRRHAGDAVVVRSAGSMPAAQVHATVQPLLDELLGDGLGTVAFPKPLTDDAVRAADVVITMGCGDTCPVLPGTRYEDWAVGDPALASPEGVRAIYDDLEERVRALAAELVPTTTLTGTPVSPSIEENL